VGAAKQLPKVTLKTPSKTAVGTVKEKGALLTMGSYLFPDLIALD
jgi:hypothetical protein